MKLLAIQLFEALDDSTLKDYNLYLEGKGEYPSEFATKALLDARDLLGISSVALLKMDFNLAKDILKGIGK